MKNVSVSVSVDGFTYSTTVEHLSGGRISDAETDRVWADLQRLRDEYILPIRVSNFFSLIEKEVMRIDTESRKLTGTVEVIEWRIMVRETFDALDGEGKKWDGKTSYVTDVYSVKCSEGTIGAFAYKVKVGEKEYTNYDGKSWKDFADQVYYQNRMSPENDFRDTFVEYPEKPESGYHWQMVFGVPKLITF